MIPTKDMDMVVVEEDFRGTCFKCNAQANVWELWMKEEEKKLKLFVNQEIQLMMENEVLKFIKNMGICCFLEFCWNQRCMKDRDPS